MVKVSYYIDEHILTSITNITSIFSQLFTFWVRLSILFLSNPDRDVYQWYQKIFLIVLSRPKIVKYVLKPFDTLWTVTKSTFTSSDFYHVSPQYIHLLGK